MAFDPARDQDTICALSTPPGHGGIAVVRVCGSDTQKFVSKICPFLPQQSESHRAYFGTLVHPNTEEPIDEVVATFFQKGQSYTGEETIEISCHGSPLVSKGILQTLVDLGCRMADRGEFTYRAFMNGRIDLVQAESVLSLIESQSERAARVALGQLKGNLTVKLETLESDITWMLAHLEASIDFINEDIEVLPYDELMSRGQKVSDESSELVKTYKTQRYLNEGFQVGLIGRPNVGKSSLLNRILEEDRAIVSDTEGTTRDTIEGSILICGVPVTFVDTAGLHPSEDEIEVKGMNRTRRAAEESDLIFYTFDASEGMTDSDAENLNLLKDKDFVVLANKSDLATARPTNQKYKTYSVSALTGSGLEEVHLELEQRLESRYSEDSGVITQARHYELLSQTSDKMQSVLKLLNGKESPEFVALDLRESLIHVQEILGKRYDDQILDRVFSEFCIGK